MSEYDEDLDAVLTMVAACEVGFVSVKGGEFAPDSEKDTRFLTMLAHHDDTRAEIESLRDMLNECLKQSTPEQEDA